MATGFDRNQQPIGGIATSRCRSFARITFHGGWQRKNAVQISLIMALSRSVRCLRLRLPCNSPVHGFCAQTRRVESIVSHVKMAGGYSLESLHHAYMRQRMISCRRLRDASHQPHHKTLRHLPRLVNTEFTLYLCSSESPEQQKKRLSAPTVQQDRDNFRRDIEFKDRSQNWRKSICLQALAYRSGKFYSFPFLRSHSF